MHGRFPSPLASSEAHVSDLTVAESVGLKSILGIHKILAGVSDRMNVLCFANFNLAFLGRWSHNLCGLRNWLLSGIKEVIFLQNIFTVF